MKIFEKKYFRFESIVKQNLSYVFTINMFSPAKNCNLIKHVFFLMLVIIYVPPINLDSWFLTYICNCCCFDSDNVLRFSKMVKCLPEFGNFYRILEK